MTAARTTAEPLLFELEIERQGTKLRARVRNSVRGMGEQIFALPPELASLGDLGRRQGQLRNLAPPAAARAAEALRKDALAVGKKLFAALFHGSVGAAYSASQAVAEETGRPLAVVLRLKREVLPLAVPWEILTDPAVGQPLATFATTPLLRSLEGMAPPERAAPAGRVEVLVGIASPAGYAALATECEWLSIRAASEGRAAALLPERLPELSVAALRERLRRGVCPIFHFIGHGEIDAATGESSLVFEGEGRKPVLLDGGSLAAILAPSGRALDGADGVRLAVLNACDSAAVSESEALSGVAQQLLRRGVPAVIAMRAAIRDTSAVEFSRVFYRELASGRPVEVAVALAREALFKEPGGVDWALPVLLAAGPVGPLLSAPPPPLPPQPPRSLTGYLAAAAALLLVPLSALLVLWRSPVEVGPLSPPAAMRPAPPDLFTDHPDCPSPPGVALGLAHIAAGAFTMGSNDAKGEKPPRREEIAEPFCLGKTEVTDAQWEAVMGGGNAGQEAAAAGTVKAGVSWDDAQAFIARLNVLVGQDAFFLPSEKQWEYAARAGTTGRYSFGDREEDLPRYGNCKSANADGYEELAPVASFEPNARGLYDMHGNASEWVEDVLGFSDPMSIKASLLAQAGRERVRRGGSYDNSPENCRSASRAHSQPDTRRPDYGLRIARRVQAE